MKSSSVVGITKKSHDENWNVRIMLVVGFDKLVITGRKSHKVSGKIIYNRKTDRGEGGIPPPPPLSENCHI